MAYTAPGLPESSAAAIVIGATDNATIVNSKYLNTSVNFVFMSYPFVWFRNITDAIRTIDGGDIADLRI
jgi:hypothetical protein